MIGIFIIFTFIALIILSVFILIQKELSHSIILYMGFGLGSTVLFFIFSAPDVALTEAVIGAGISGVIFLVALLQTKVAERV
jgi:multicomponent Na+:H+ antiporter subunit B